MIWDLRQENPIHIIKPNSSVAPWAFSVSRDEDISFNTTVIHLSNRPTLSNPYNQNETSHAGRHQGTKSLLVEKLGTKEDNWHQVS